MIYDPETLQIAPLHFFKAILDAIEDQVAVIDSNGILLYVNASWVQFGKANDMSIDINWIGQNYLNSCNTAKQDCINQRVAKVINRVCKARPGTTISLEYPCHRSPKKRWYCVKATRTSTQEGDFVVIVHSEITQRKQAELRAKRQAIHDPLTSLYNRRAFEDSLKIAWRQCKRETQPLSLLSIDIDHFKQLNDTLGHPAGDACLKSVAAVIRCFARRPEDLAARVGGEEFVVLLPKTPLDAARHMAERLRRTVAGCDVLGDGGHTLVTVSIGIASVVPERDAKVEALLSAADVALYSAKHCGRDRVMVGVDLAA
ncbi:GGDEF domain-containing protein [Uliginosibacterium gangwonense]|uniref:GGDEF domain-containing protein n=1 Tax=Uliginosibacterium gangwonense TaxID=392736 RepID=UPI00036A429C|nr:GGDEF domain-containing protein [Uliginosibacterium gangwonense]